MADTQLTLQEELLAFAGNAGLSPEHGLPEGHLHAFLKRVAERVDQLVTRVNAIVPAGVLTATDVRDLGSIAALGAQEVWTKAVAGSLIGDKVHVVSSIDQGLLKLDGYVSVNGTVTVVATNDHTAAVDLGSATYTIYVLPKTMLDAWAAATAVDDLNTTIA